MALSICNPHVINMLSDVENTLKDDEFFADTFDTPKGSVDQHNKQECLKGAKNKGKVSNNQRKNVFIRQQKAMNT